MNAATITALSGAIVAIIGAATALVHSLSTRRQLHTHQASDQHSPAPGSPSPAGPAGG